MEGDPRVWIRALRHSQDRLASIVQPLRREQLLQPSYHSWTIAEVLSHLGSAAEIFQHWLTAALEGTEPPGPEANQPIWDSWNARGPEAQARDSIEINEGLVRRFETLTDEELAGIHLAVFGMQLDAAGLVRLRLGEHAVHTWDIAVALDPTAQVLPDAVALLIDTVSMIAGFAGKAQDREFRLRVRTTDPERDVSLRVGGTVEINPGDSDGGVDGDLTISAEAFLRLVYGRLDPGYTPEVEINGPVTLDDLRRVFPGV